MTVARYDAVADFYEAGWTDACDDPPTVALMDLVGMVAGQRVLDVACGHGRLSRALARRGADVTGVDISGVLIDKAQALERTDRLGIRYVHADVAASTRWLRGGTFDLAVCNFGLSDIDDLSGCLSTTVRALRPGGRFVFSILHPCFAGGGQVSGAWPAGGGYHDEGWWSADRAASTLRHRVGANHRTLSTYLNALRRHDLWCDEVVEPLPSSAWSTEHREAARFPVFLAVRCVRR